jgi:transcriptional regulator with XRE-family HTH domain
MPSETLKILDQVRKLRTEDGLSAAELSRRAGMPESTMRKLLNVRSKRKPSPANYEKLRKLLFVSAPRPSPGVTAGPFPAREAARRAQHLAELLCGVEEELGWFKDGPPEARHVYRSALDQFDAGYVASLMTMMFDEGQLQRWQAVGTVRFNRFRKKEGQR